MTNHPPIAIPDVIWVADPRVDQNINGFKQTIGLYTSVEPTGGNRYKYVRAESVNATPDRLADVMEALEPCMTVCLPTGGVAKPTEKQLRSAAQKAIAAAHPSPDRGELISGEEFKKQFVAISVETLEKHVSHDIDIYTKSPVSIHDEGKCIQTSENTSEISVITDEEMSDIDPVGDAYAKGYGDGYKARAIAAEQDAASVEQIEALTRLIKRMYGKPEPVSVEAVAIKLMENAEEYSTPVNKFRAMRFAQICAKTWGLSHAE